MNIPLVRGIQTEPVVATIKHLSTNRKTAMPRTT